MTLLMNMVITAEERMTNHSKHLRQLIELIIKEEFQLQHYQGITKKSKKNSTVLIPGQEIELKKNKNVQ